MAQKRTRVRVIRPYWRKVDGEVSIVTAGAEIEELEADARSLEAVGKVEILDRPPASIPADELAQLEAERRRRREEAEARAQRLSGEATTDEAPEKAARTGKAGR